MVQFLVGSNQEVIKLVFAASLFDDVEYEKGQKYLLFVVDRRHLNSSFFIATLP